MRKWCFTRCFWVSNKKGRWANVCLLCSLYPAAPAVPIPGLQMGKQSPGYIAEATVTGDYESFTRSQLVGFTHNPGGCSRAHCNISFSWPYWPEKLTGRAGSDVLHVACGSATRWGGEGTCICSAPSPLPGDTRYASPWPTYGQAEPEIHGGAAHYGAWKWPWTTFICRQM